MTVERREYLNNYCANKVCIGFKDGECDNCMYELGRADVINEIYAKFMNEDKDSILEWLQDNITD